MTLDFGLFFVSLVGFILLMGGIKTMTVFACCNKFQLKPCNMHCIESLQLETFVYMAICLIAHC